MEWHIGTASWKAEVLAAEQFAVPTVRCWAQMAQSNAELLDWVRHHRYLAPVDINDGESGIALLILWEVDHGRPFPTHGGAGLTAALVGFTRRLKVRVQRDAEMSRWLVCQETQRTLVHCLPPVHRMCWSIKLVPPPDGEP